MTRDQYAGEARERWGHTAAYAESQRRIAAYTDADWARMRAESDAIGQTFLALMEAGEAPDSKPAREAAERHRQHISRWFYDCPRETHAALGEMYVTDHRFTENIDQAGSGLARYMAAAIRANATA